MRGHLWLLAVGWGLLQATDLVSPARSEGTGSEEEAVWPTTPALQCGIDQFKCEDGLRCIPQDWYCDHLPHCADASDELDCFTAHLEVACALGEFRCDTGACIPEKFRCNGRLDCGRRDYSDEESCPTANPYSQRKKCAPNTSYCATPVQGNYVCLFVEMFCDGRSHCFDGSDEWDVCDEAHNRTKCANLGCEMGCRPTFEGPTCYCENGYTPSGLRCVDEDECQWDMCDQLCTNTQGGYNCSCVDGFTQLDDPRGCRPTEEPVLVVGTPRDLRLYRAGRPVGVVPEPGVTAAYVDRDAGSFCYIRRNLTDASFVCRETARPERASVRPAPRMFPDLSSVGALAADWVSGNLYLADEKREAVYVCRADGVRCRLVVTGRLNRLRGLAVDAAAGVMFWTVWGTSESALERALLDGSRRKSLVALEVSQPGAVAVDPHVRRVYWLEGHYRGRLYRADYWGGHDEVVYNRQENEPVRGMSVVPPTLWLPLNLSVRPVWVSHARAPHPELPELKLEVRPAFTLVAHPQPEVPHHPCGTDNGGCDHLCITSYNESRPRARCMCSHGYRLAGHAECVRAELKEFMVVVLGAPAMIKSVPLAGDSLHWDWEPLVPVTDVGRPSALAYDAAERVLYWTDVARHEIARQRLDGTGRETLLTGIEEPAGLALDPLARNLYWTDAALGTVNVARLSRLTARRALLTETGPRPRSIVLDPPGARMFWAAWSSDGGDARLQTADTAGGSVRALPAEKLRRPVGLVLYANRLYWCDTALDRVAYVDLNTEMTINVARASKPTGAFVLSGLPFWAERDTGLLMRGDMSGPVKMRDVPPPVLALQLVREEEPAGRHGCARDYGGCAELCLPTPEGRTCACAADDATCRETEPAPVPVCPDGQFHCGRGRCIDSLYVCDGDPDCPDGSDENATAAGVCAHAECPDEHFQCDTTRCIVRSWVCDGLKDCRDGTDEGAEACGRTSCGAGQFVCATSRRCVPAAWRCDGAADCGAGDTSDELGCAGAAACPPSMFSCDDGGCAPWEYYCDGRADCRDASDERACASTTPAPARALDTAAPAVCEEHEFQCRNTECIRNDFRCDGRVDCLDGSDEQRCDTTATPPATQHETRHETTSESPGTTVADSCSWPALSCDNATRCVPPLQLCDGSADCRDGADEADRCGEDMCAEWTCSHGCQPAPAGPVCSCPAGLHLQTDRRSCGPDHPCQEWGVCSQTCQPQKNRHKCTCLEGYRLADDGFTCKSTDDTAPLLVFSNRHELRALELRGGAGTGAGGTGGSRPLVSSLKNSIALDWHRAGPAAPHVLYWSDVLDDAIYRGELAGGVLARIEPVLRGGLVAAEGLAVDWVAANLYWVAGAPRQIEVATLDGRHRTTLLAGGMEQPRALALDARRGLLFWTDWEEREPRIERCTLSGRDRRVAVAIEPGGWPNGLALDFAPERLYWIDAHSDSVHTSLYDGGDRREVLRGHPALSHPFAIALFESHVYWTDWRANGVVRANKWNGSDAVVVQRTLSQPFDVKVVHASRRPRADTPCSVRAGGCSHLCLISEPGKRECACPHAMRLATDGETCTPREVALLVARAGELLGLDPEEPARPLLPAVAGRPLAPVALHFHAASRRIFWADSGLNEVRAVGLTSGPPVTLADAGVHSPRALALDWLAGLLFYSTRRADGDAVLVTDLAGERPAVLLDESAALGRVTGLAAHPRRGKLYWTRRADGRDVLEESGEDGSARRLIASGTGPAGGLALDATAGLLYWVNTDDGSVRSADPLSGRVRDVALPTGAHASAVAVHGGLLYWADEAAGSLRSCPPDNCTQPRTLRNDTDEVLALRVYDASEQAERGGACSLRRTPCTQLCLPVSETDSVCRCALGYTADGPRCEGAKEAVIFSTGSSVVGVAPDSGQEVLARLPRTAGASSLGLLVAEDAIFWADGERGGIWRVRRDGSERRAVLPPGLDDAPAGLALDGAGDALYWGDTRARLVEVSRTDGSHRAALLELPAAPSSLVLDEAGGWLFVAAGGCVSRARPDGSDHRLLHNGTVVLGLGAHPASRTLFLLESGPPAALRSLPYEGGESALLLSDSPLQHPVALAVSDDRLYWLDTQHERGALMTAPLSDVSAARPLLTELGDSLKDVTVWSTVRSSASAAHPCSVNNGGCSQLCLSDGSRAQCVCPHGRVTPQGRCEPHEQFVVFARVSRLEFLHATDDGPLNAPYGSIENKELMRNAIALTYEYNSSLLFYSDIQRGTINMVHFNGTDHSVLVDQQGAVEGLAFESTSRTLYWSSSGPPRLMRASLTELLGAAPGARAERVRTVLYLERGARPRGLDVDPCLSRVYWADWNSTRPAIQRAFSNGYQLETVIRTDILMPNGLALDRAARKLYWADARLDKIERAEYDGSRRRVLTSSLAAHPFDLSVLGGYVYWTDWVGRGVFRADKLTGDAVQLRADVPRPMGVAAAGPEPDSCPPDPCRLLNGGCAELCRTDAAGAVECACRESRTLSPDGHTCADPTSTARCPEDRFACTEGGQCVPLELTCDGVAHCGPVGNSSDEDLFYCTSRPCPRGWFSCGAGGRCAPPSAVCDGRADCDDAADERSCECGPQQARCASGRCVPASWRCDGVAQCADGSDELQCPRAGCAALGPTARPCSSGGGCYLPSWHCDKARDCDDGSDEWNCTFVDADSAASDTSVMETAVSGCGEMQFACGNGTGAPVLICIPASWRCDGRADCADESDETVHCRARARSYGNCSREEYRCDDGACVPRGVLCDGVSQCAAGEDERQCDCAPDTFRCRDSAECRDRALYCDGDADCEDGSDEPPGCSARVSSPPPPPDEVPCAAEPGSVSCAGRCVPRDLRCDGRDHCQDGGGRGAGTDEDPVDCSSYEHNVGGGTGATGESCAADRWRCAGGACVSRGALCDGHDDCGDFSDELHCHIDECKFENGGCSQHCADLPVGRACWCRAGFRLDGDGSTCHDVDECREDRPCDHACRNTVGSYACSCRAGYSLAQDGLTCAADGDVEAALIFTNRYYIRRAELRPGAPTALLVHNLTNGVALDMDWAGGCLYWSDVTRAGSSIRRACRDEPGRQQVLHAATLQNPDGLAVDWVAGNLYWCDKGTDTIEVSRLDGRHRRVLLRDGLQEPRALALDPLAGLLYWSDWGSRAHIGRAGMDGAGRRVLLARGLGWPNALTLHRPADELYFADAREDYVAVLELGSLRVRTLLSRARQPWLRLHHVFALAVWGDRLYWSDWEMRAVEGCRRIPPPASPADCHTVTALLHKPMDLRVFHPARQPPAPELSAACAALRCAGACLLAAGPGGARATCSCPEHFELSPDGRSCSPRCTSAHFECRSTLKCIPYWWRCDTQDDCGDGSDEARSCPRFYCAPGQFQCDTERCLHPAALCDGTAQCTDGADERDCEHFTCLASQWKCPSDPANNATARCIPAALRCDGRADCAGGHDEAGCPPRTCPPHHFTCDNGRCITPVWVCDADSDCGDGSDERDAMCAARTCSRAEFRCDSGRCIPRDWLCDDEPDCPGREDERSCDLAPCEPTYFRCPGTDRRCVPGRWRCDFEEDCADGADERDCKPRACSESEFRCGTGECVRGALVCSGTAECGDGSDEEGCGATCPPGARACKAGPHCVPQEWWCDGESDCGDGSDEEECEGDGALPDELCGGPGGFRCGPGAACMPPAWRCDGRADCVRASDERDCENLACPPDEFRCADGTCITDNLLCDGTKDCRAGDDEEARVCAGRPACLSGRLPCGDGRCVPDDLLCDEPGADECEFGTCSQLCLARKRRADGGARLCKCAPGYRMPAGRPGREGGHACEPLGREPRLLVGGSDGVRLWEMSKSSRDARGVWPAGTRVTGVTGALRGDAWWAWAVRGGAVYRANVTAALLGSGDAIVDGEPLLRLEDERALAVWAEGDWDRLYVSSAGPRGGALHVTALDGRRRVVLWRRAGSWPSSLALHAAERLVFWSDAGSRPSIMVCGTDGGSPRELVTRHLRRPAAVAVDGPARRLYFSDVRLHTLETVRLDGGDRRLLADFGRHDSPHSVQQLSRVPTGEVRGAAVVGEWLLVACRRGLLRVHKRTPPADTGDTAHTAANSTAPPLLGQYAEARGARLSAVTVLHEALSRTDEPDACAGRCGDSALCVPRAAEPGYSCLCPDGLLPDESEPAPDRRACVPSPRPAAGTSAPDSSACPLRCPPERSCALTAGAWRCACPALYSGPRCDVPRCPAGCACPEPAGPDESPPRCVCAADRDGPSCARSVSAGHEMPPCAARPCLHGGTCSTLQGRSYCVCPPGHSGRRCEVCQEPQLCRHNTTSTNNWNPTTTLQCGPTLSCEHGGRCVQLSESGAGAGRHSSVCVCEGGWGGALCDEYVGHDHACLTARCPPPAVCVWRGREPYCACPARAACTPRDLCRKHCAERACFLDGLGRPQCRCGPHCSFDPALEASPRGLPGATLTGGVLAALALLAGVLAALYVLRGRRRRSFGHRRLADNVEITNPMYQPHDDDDLPPQTSPSASRAGTTTTSHHFANPVYDTMYAGPDDVRAVTTEHEHAGLLSELSDSPGEKN